MDAVSTYIIIPGIDGGEDGYIKGLQSTTICNEALIAARETAADEDQPVVLVDGSDITEVRPDGSLWETTLAAWGFGADDDDAEAQR